jgi:hypothetical protein
MPRGDGIGPRGMGPGTGSGLGQGRGRGRMGQAGLGPGGNCVCPLCGTTVSHQRGVPCSLTSCPKCGARMTRR